MTHLHDPDLADITVLEWTHALARQAADAITEATGAPCSVDEVQLSLSFTRGEAHWTARAHGLAVKGSSPLRSLRSLVMAAGIPRSA